MWKEYLPSKKVVAFLIIPILTIIILIILNNYINSNDKKIKDYSKIKKSIASEENRDTDSDGLFDWEEDIAGTDKENKDTDGDGLSDGLEVATGSDPLDPLNKNKRTERILDKTKNHYNYLTDPNLTTTDRVAIQFLEEGMKLKKSNMSFNKDAQRQVINKILSSNIIDINLNKYKISDLKIDNKIKNNDFLNEFNSAVSDFQNYHLKEETVLLTDYLMNKDEKKIEEIQYNITIYKKYLDKLLKLKVSKKIANEYLDFLNSIETYIQVLENYTYVKDDPVSTIQAMGISKEVDKRLADSYKKLMTKLTK